MFDNDVVPTLMIFALSLSYTIPLTLKRVFIWAYPKSMVYLSLLPLVTVTFCLSEIPPHTIWGWVDLFLWSFLLIDSFVPLIKQVKYKAVVVLNVDEDSLRNAITENHPCTWETMFAVLENDRWIRRAFRSKNGFRVSFDDGNGYLRIDPLALRSGYVLYPRGKNDVDGWTNFFDALFANLRVAKPHPNVGYGMVVFYVALIALAIFL